jgi:uncharacterized protein YegL
MADIVDRGAGAGRRLHVLFLVDGSGSMLGERMGALNWAAKTAIPAMRDCAAEHPGVEVLVRVCRFADEVSWPVAAPGPVESFVWANLAAGGETRLGAALAEVASALAATEAAEGPGLPPVIILLSDGMPSDDTAAGLAALDATEPGRRAIRIPIAIGPDADLEWLQRFVGAPSPKPLRADSAASLVRRMCWAATVPLGLASATGTGPKAEGPPPGGAPAEPEDNLLW